ncbi:S9 family peptidase [Sphingomonas daechungensis]|uniref:alpha/beta hydrolase family protein n=1 Tax=Sphingomonas daechungensis TaxID=1176646 RepID=UPI0031EC1E2A
MVRSYFWGVLALAGGTAAFGATPLPDAVPVEVFAALPGIESPELSPNGEKVAAKIAIDGQQYLVVQPLFGGKTSALMEDKSDINWWQWVNDDWLVVGVGDNVSLYGMDFYATAIVGVSADMKTVKRVDPFRNGVEADDVIWYAKDGSPRVLLSKETGIETPMEWQPSVWDVDVSTGKGKMVTRAMDDVWEWDADPSGMVRYGIIWRDGKRAGIYYRGPDGGNFQKISFAKRQEASVPLPVAYRADGNAIAIDDSDGRDSVYELSLPSFTLGKKLFGDPKYDVDAVILNVALNDAAGFRVVGKRSRIEWLDEDLKDIQKGLDQTLGSGNARIVSWSRNRKQLLVEVGKPSQAGGLYYWDTNGATMQRIGWNNSVLKDRNLSAVSTVQYKARDGVPIEAVLTLPRGREAKNLPLIMMPHGGPEARDSEEYDWWAQYLAELGYVVIQPNYRGSSGYGTEFVDRGRGEWGLKMQDDLIDGIDWLAAQGVVDPKRVCIIGASYGGYAAMRGAQRDGSRYRCAVSYAGVSDLNVMLKYDRSMMGKGMVEYWKARAADLDAVSPRYHAASFGAPILIAHGVEDKRVPVKQSRMLVSELQKAVRIS